MFSSTYKNTIVKQPASLQYLSTLSSKELMCKIGENIYPRSRDCDVNLSWILKCCYHNPTAYMHKIYPFECNLFYFNLVNKHAHFGELFDSYVDLLYDVLRENEFCNLYFHFLAKYVQYKININRCIVPVKINVTPHFYEYLYVNGFIDKLFLCKNLDDASNILLSGDIEENPGPTYKELCRKQYKKNRYAKTYQQLKQEQQMNRELNRRENTDLEIQYEIRNVNMQVLSTLAGCLPSAYMGYKTNATLNKANIVLDSLSEQVTTVLNSFKNIIKNIETRFNKSLDILSLITDFIFAIIQISYSKASKRIHSFSLEIFRILIRHGFPSEICKSVVNFVREYINKSYSEDKVIYDKKEVKIQGAEFDGVDVKLQFPTVLPQKNIFEEYLTPNYLVLGLFAILSLVFTSVLPEKNTCEKLIERLGKIGRSSRGIKDLASVSHESISYMLEYFKVNVLNLRPELEVENFISGIDRWFDEVREFLDRVGEVKKSDRILTDPKIIVEVENLYRRGMEFSKEIADKKLHRELQLPFQTHMKYLTDIIKLVDTSGAFGTRPRTQPVVIWLYGESGVGKSGMSWPLAVDLNNMFVQNKEEAKEFSKNIYMRNVEQEFWDNYQGQNVVIYDDFGQRVDSTSNPNEEFMELIRTANIAPYPLHMAHLEDKRKTRFVSKVVLMTSNVFEHQCNSLTFPDAFRRRVDLCAKIRNKSQYTKLGFSKALGSSVPRLDPDKVRNVDGKIVSTSVYEIDLVNPESGEIIEEGLDYDSFLKIAQEKARKAFNFSQEMNQFLEEYAEKRFVEMQINVPKISDFWFYKELTDQSFDEIRQLVESGQLFLRSKMIKIEDFDDVQAMATTSVMDGDFEFIPDPDDIHRLTLSYLKEHCIVRYSKIGRQLNNIRMAFRPKLLEWKDNMVKYVKEHPFTVVAGILITISSLLALGKFYNYLFSIPSIKNNLLKESYKLDNVIYKAYNNIKVSDCTQMSTSQLMRWYPVISSVPLPILIKQFDPLLHEFLKGVNGDLEIFVLESTFKDHGRNIKVEASVSGDNVTQAMNRVKVEAAMSGDNLTVAGQKVQVEGEYFDAIFKPATILNDTLSHIFNPSGKLQANDESWVLEKYRASWRLAGSPKFYKIDNDKVVALEANVSGDNITQNINKIKVEASVSGDNITQNITKVRVEANNVSTNMQMWQDQVAQNLITNRIFSNMYKICKKVSTGSLPLLHGLFVRGQCMLVPGHLMGFLDSTDTIELYNVYGLKYELPWKVVKSVPIVDSFGDGKEAQLLIFPNYIHAHCDLVKHFSNSDSMSSYKRANCCLPLMRYSEKIKHFIITILGNTQCVARDDPLILNDAKLGQYMLRKGLEYNLNTTFGDCGAPLIINENKVLRKIAGIHVAGDPTRAYAESITQSDLERAFKNIPVEMQIQTDLDESVEIKDLSLEYNKDYSVEELAAILPAPGFTLGGFVEKLYEPNKTEIQKSLIYGKVSKITTKPAYLKYPNVNMKHKNLAKCVTQTPYIPEEDMEESLELVKSLWLSNRRLELAKVLSYEEAITGNETSEFIGPINRSSSPGYPWIKQRESGMKGKTTWFGDDEYVFSPEVRMAVERRIEAAKKGVRVPTFWVDTLKDERRPIEKVEALKTRVFSNGPMDFNITFRMFFLGFIAHLMENRIKNEVSLGTNVYSQDWKKTALKVTSKGSKVIAGDFSTFDGTLNSSMMQKFVILANEFYDDGEENFLIREVLFKDIYNSIHLCDGVIYLMSHSQPSGNPATTPLNCLINSLGIRMCFKKIIERFQLFKRVLLKEFTKYVSIVSFGDDNLINFHDSIAEYFNMDTLTWAFSTFGYIYTDDTKALDGSAPLWKSIDEITYLKRKFRFDKNKQRWEAPLLLDTILETPNWCKSSLDIQEGTKVNCENSIMELSMHEEEIFNVWSKKIQAEYYKVTGDRLDIRTYKGYSDQRYVDYYL